jgi:hypothetical protein
LPRDRKMDATRTFYTDEDIHSMLSRIQELEVKVWQLQKYAALAESYAEGDVPTRKLLGKLKDVARNTNK